MASEGTLNRIWILKQHPKELPTDEDIVLEESSIPELNDGEMLIRSHYISVDPYQRGQMMKDTAYSASDVGGLGAPIPGGGVGSVIKSRNDDFPVGTLVAGMFGWVEYLVSSGKGLSKVPASIPKLSYSQGILGMTGATAYFGTFKLLEPKAGKTLFVSGAAGAVGSVVGQIAKAEGLHVVGSAGSQEKLDWLKNDLGFDAVVSYRGKDFEQLTAEIKELAPQGIDCYFDNTGGPVTDAVIGNMNPFGRIALCGQITGYNKPVLSSIPQFTQILVNQVRVEGFLVTRWQKEWPEAFKYIAGKIVEGKIKPRETITEGFENTFKAFLGLFTGENFGKQIVHVSDP